MLASMTKLAFAAGTLVSITSAANTMKFVNQDDTPRYVYCSSDTSSPVSATGTQVNGLSSLTLTFDEAWSGNCHSQLQLTESGDANTGCEPNGCILAEVTFNNQDLTWYDVSAIGCDAANEDIKTDTNGVKFMFPSSQTSANFESMGADEYSGCQTFPCDNSYLHPPDVQTKQTAETEITVLLGTWGGDSKKARDMKDEMFLKGRYATGKRS